MTDAIAQHPAPPAGAPCAADTTSTPPTVHDLPEGVLQKIFRQLGADAFTCAAQTCTGWRRLCGEPAARRALLLQLQQPVAADAPRAEVDGAWGRATAASRQRRSGRHMAGEWRVKPVDTSDVVHSTLLGCDAQGAFLRQRPRFHRASAARATASADV